MEIQLTYTELKNIIIAKALLWQYTELTEKYIIYAVDPPLEYIAVVYKSGYDPIGVNSSSDRNNFESNYKSTANKPLIIYQQAVTQVLKPSYGLRSWQFSHNYCDKTTWFGDAVRVVNEAVGTGDGATTVFNLANTNVLDVTHGKIPGEISLVPTASQGGTTYAPEIKIADVTKTERAFGAGSGGDYTINYATGAITFFVAPTNGAAITATYFRCTNSTMYIRPSTGKKLHVTSAECMFSSDLVFTDALISAVFTYNPGLGAPPAKFEYPSSRGKYSRMTDYIAYTNGAFPIIPAIGGATRGSQHDIFQLRFDYVTSLILDDAYGAELRIWTENHTLFTGECGQITFYGYEP